MQGTQEWKESEEEEKLVSKDIVKYISNEFPRSTLARKACRNCIEVPVPQTDTGRRGENPKADERNVVKELGKITP